MNQNSFMNNLLTAFAVIRQIFERVAKPHPEIIDAARRRQAQLTAGLTLALTFSLGSAFLASVSTNGVTSSSISLIVLAVLAFVSYVLSRSRYPYLGSILLVLSLGGSGFSLAIASSTNPIFTLVTTVTISIILGSALLPSGLFALYSVLVIIGAFATQYFVDPLFGLDLQVLAGQFLVWAVLLLIINASRNAIERDRIEEVERANRELKNFQENLERIVFERTEELNLAAELGQRLTQVLNMEKLIDEAVNLIQSRFGLYYVQIYLVDPARSAIVLKGGSGEIGQQLKMRGHRLPLSLGSINGRAAYENHPVVVENTISHPDFRPNAFLPNTRSEMALPLNIGNKVIGVLDIQSEQIGYLNPERVISYQTLAGQLAIAIENATLIEQTEQARQSLEEQAKRFTRNEWQEFLNSIDRDETIGYVYSNGTLSEFHSPNNMISTGDSNHILEIPIRVSGVTIGRIEVEKNSDQDSDGDAWSNDESEIVQAVAEQVSRQVENLRLLAQSEHYRQEAELVSRQATRQGWESYLEQIGDRLLAYQYDQTSVKPVDSEPDGSDAGIMISQDLKVREEKFGELVVTGLENVDPATMEVLNTVSERLSLHLETLRLSEQTQRALTVAERQAKSLAMLNEMAGKLTNAASTQEIFRVSLSQTQRIVGSNHITIALPLPESGEAELFTIDENDNLSTGIRLRQQGTLFGLAMQEKRMINYPEEDTNFQGEPRDVLLIRKYGLRTVIAAPLIASGNVLGVLSVSSKAAQFDDNQRSLLAQVVSLVSSALENRILLETVQARARREQNLRQITSAVRSSVDPEYILKTAAKELGTAMKRKVIIRLAGNTVENGEAA